MVRQYIGARYVPAFFENSLGTAEWEAGVSYEPLTIVTYSGNSYTSKKPVPSNIGNPAANSAYWANTGNFNAQLAELTPLIELSVREFATVADMVTSDLQDGIFAHCATYSGNGGEGILYAITETASSFAVPLMNGRYAEPLINNTEVHVSQFGAVGDGQTDDTAAIQKAIDYAGANGTVIIDRKECAITSTLVVSANNMAIIGSVTPEYRSTLAIGNGSTVSPVIDVRGRVFNMRGVHIFRRLINRQSLSGIGVRIKHPDPASDPGWYNMDAYFEKCIFMGFGIGADAYGRNIVFRDDTHFSNCMIGVHYHSKNGTEEAFSRGWIVEGCRFHSMGDEQVWTDPATCPCIAVKSDLNSITREVVIKNNVFDGDCTCMMYYGSTDGLIIDGNTVESGDRVTFGYLKRSSSNVNNYPVIQNNVVNTLPATSLGVYSDVMMYIAGARVQIKNNVIRNSMKHLIKGLQLDTGSTSLNHLIVAGNSFWISESNTDFVDPTSDIALYYTLLANTFFTTGGATGITLGQVATIENQTNVSVQNVWDSGVSV